LDLNGLPAGYPQVTGSEPVMLRKRIALSLAVVVAGASAAITGILRADAAPAPAAGPTFVVPTPSPTPTRTKARAAKSCAAGGVIAEGRYWLHNNQWGKDTGDGSQCVRAAGGSGGTLAWDTSWKWTGRANSVKSYAAAVLGWHWGWKARDTGLPIRLSAGRAVRTTWDFAVTRQGPNTLNVSYDLWLHDTATPDSPDEPTDEVMVWLYHSGDAGPIGTKQATVTIAGTGWDLYRGEAGWNVFSFVRTGNTTSADLNLTDFTDELTTRGWLPRTKYLSSVEAGTEIFTGEGALDTSAYAVTIT
jgi:xyloglucan-specific endo-beta-1,4-glucanase